MGQLEVGASGVKALLWNLAIINQRLEGLEAIQELVHIVHHLQTQECSIDQDTIAFLNHPLTPVICQLVSHAQDSGLGLPWHCGCSCRCLICLVLVFRCWSMGVCPRGLTLHAAPQDLSLGLPSRRIMTTAVMSSTPGGGFFSDLASPAPKASSTG